MRHSNRRASSSKARPLIGAVAVLVLLGILVLVMLMQPSNDESATPYVKLGEANSETQSESKFLQDAAGREEEVSRRLNAVRMAMRHAWKGYSEFAWGMDELKPLSHSHADDMLKLGMTIVDGIDTLWIMGLNEEYQRARDWIATSLNFKTGKPVSTFETTIRILGGLLSAYDLTNDKMFLDRATELGDRLLPAFDSENGFPYPYINLGTGKAYGPSWMLIPTGSTLSEVGSIQMEFFTLSHHTGNPIYQYKAQKAIDLLDNQPKTPTGLFPVSVTLSSGDIGRDGGQRVRLGARGDSFYEYLLKMYLLTKETLPQYRRMYNQVVAGILDHMVFVSPVSKLTYVAELESPNLPAKPRHKMDHLVCFAAGMFALGSDSMFERADRQLEVAKGIGHTCHEMYARSATGLGPEKVVFRESVVAPVEDMVVPDDATHFILRPEAIEAWFVLYRKTGDPIYQEWAWRAFESIERYCRTDIGYSGILDVTNPSSPKDDSQQSFFLAETLKYLYLIFAPPSTISLDEFVFNTEAHPFRKFVPAG